MRSDLPVGVKLAQTVHAAGESAGEWTRNNSQALPPNTHAVVLAAPSLLALEQLEGKLKSRDVPHRAIREPDAPWNGQLMAIGLQPAQRELVRRLVSNFPLVRE